MQLFLCGLQRGVGRVLELAAAARERGLSAKLSGHAALLSRLAVLAARQRTAGHAAVLHSLALERHSTKHPDKSMHKQRLGTSVLASVAATHPGILGSHSALCQNNIKSEKIGLSKITNIVVCF